MSQLRKTKPYWNTYVMFTPTSHIIVYTDSSQETRFRRTGAAAVGFHQGNETFKQRMSLGSIAEVYDAELTGLVVGLRAAIMKAESLPKIHHILVYADNMSAIKKNSDNTLRIAWCPGQTSQEMNGQTS